MPLPPSIARSLRRAVRHRDRLSACCNRDERLRGWPRTVVQRGTEMKIRRPLFFAVVVATAVSLASIAASAVAAETPFKGTANAVETSEESFSVRLDHSARHGHRHASRQVHIDTRPSRSTL